jgi:hypothetical protein
MEEKFSIKCGYVTRRCYKGCGVANLPVDENIGDKIFDGGPDMQVYRRFGTTIILKNDDNPKTNPNVCSFTAHCDGPEAKDIMQYIADVVEKHKKEHPF